MSSDGGILSGLDLFYGEASSNLARIYARVSAGRGLSLGGFVRGPYCESSRTLPTTTPLVDRGPGESLLAEAIVPDPCFWTPDVPSLYHVRAELKRDGQVVETSEREFALRALGPRGRSLFLQGKRWVLRGVEADSALSCEWDAWQEAPAAMIVSSANDELCREATRLGVFLVARVRGSAAQVVAELRRLARYGAVGVAIIESNEASDDAMRQAVPNVLLAQPLLAREESLERAPWSQLIVAEVDEPARFAARVKDCPIPIVASRQLSRAVPLAEARAACDLLQRDLAPHGDYAGYVV